MGVETSERLSDASRRAGPQRAWRGRARRLLPVLAVAMLLPTAGCNWFAAFGSLLAPDPKDEALVALPANARVLIMLESRDVFVNPAYRRAFMDEVEGRLRANTELQNFVSASELAMLRREQPDAYASMPIQSIARYLNADVVIYTEVRDYYLKPLPTDPIWRGRVELGTKLIHGKDGERLWPETRDGHTIIKRSPSEAKDGSEEDMNDRVSEFLGRVSGREVAELFYEHKTETVRTRETTVYGTQRRDLSLDRRD